MLLQALIALVRLYVEVFDDKEKAKQLLEDFEELEGTQWLLTGQCVGAFCRSRFFPLSPQQCPRPQLLILE